MSSPRGAALWWFVGVTAVMLAVLSWLTVTLLQLDLDERDARREAARQERLRLALWRMDSWLAPQLVRESLRPATDYDPFPRTSNAWTSGFNKIAPNQVLVQSPLLGAESELFPLHFEVTSQGLCSPQSPTGNERDFAEANGISGDVLDRARKKLLELQGSLPVEDLSSKLSCAILELPKLGGNVAGIEQAPAPVEQVETPESPRPRAQLASQAQTMQSVNELDNRQRAFRNNIANDVANYGNPGGYLGKEDDAVGPMVPVWLDGGGAELVFARRVVSGGAARMQAVLVDWPRLESELLALVTDLFEHGCARIVRCEEPSAAEQPSMLASVPARLEAEFRGPVMEAELPINAILWTTWGVTLLGLCVLGFTLRTAIGFGERRARFASAVTHELRTPLTTFRMYSEMLADGVVKDPDAQREYLTTLQRESDRLARVVENVLAWSRLEEGRFTGRRERVAVNAVVDRVVPVIGRRLGEVGMMLDVRFEDDARPAVLETDEEAVGQILFNLADNAAKYASGAHDKTVHLSIDVRDGQVSFTTCDHGPGVAAEHREAVFVPFDRGAVRGGSNDVPGVGLGLPLARGLARDLGGELYLQDGPGGGACFVLELPIA
ncbi:MAG: sensor histidine kinase [Planctomycetota bacterium]